MQHGCLQEPEHAAQARRAREIPPDEHQQHRAQRHEHAPCGGLVVDVQRRFPAQKRPLQQERGRNEHAVPQAEGNIAEVRPVPDADDEIDDERRERRGKDLAARAPDVCAGPAGESAEGFRQRQRIKHIVAHPRAERDVPAPPVFRQGHCEDRAAEILGHVNAEHPRDTARNIDAAGKIAVELNAVEQNAAGNDRAAVGAVFRDDSVDQHSRPVGNDELFEIPPEAKLDAEFEIAPVQTALSQKLRGKLVVPADGALHHLREERDEQAVFQRVFLRGELSAVDVDDIAHALKDEIRQAQRHDEIPPGKLVPEGGRQRGGREVPVFHEI